MFPQVERFMRHGFKHVRCPYCKQEWLTGKKGGGLVVGSAKRHVIACAKKQEKNGKGYICECGRYHPFSSWVFAHPNTDIKHVCVCEKENIINI